MLRKLIIIEDCNAINYIISTVFKKDFQITSARNCRDAMMQLQSNAHIDLVILNIPDVKSEYFELLEHISTSCVSNNIHIVVISDSDDVKLRNKTSDLGVSLYIAKPFDPVLLFEKVSDLIDLNENSFGKRRRFSFNINLI